MIIIIELDQCVFKIKITVSSVLFLSEKNKIKISPEARGGNKVIDNGKNVLLHKKFSLISTWCDPRQNCGPATNT